MQIEVTHAVWLNQADFCSIENLAEVSGLSLDELNDLVESGSIEPLHATRPDCFALLHVTTARRARRLRDDFQLDRNGVALAMALMLRIDALERALESARAHRRDHESA